MYGQKKVIAILIFFLLQGTGHAQQVIPRFEVLSVNEGLSQSSVYAITQDKKGFMWFGTADGLNRYDGTELKVYKVQDDNLEMESNFMRGNLVADDAGNLWYSNETGVYCYDYIKDKVVQWRTFDKKEFQFSAFNGICMRNGIYWMINTSFGVYGYNIQTRQMIHYGHPVFGQQKGAFNLRAGTDPRGNIWFNAHKGEGVYKFDLQRKTFEHHAMPDDFVAVDFGRRYSYRIMEDRILVCEASGRMLRQFSFYVERRKVSNITAVFEDKFDRIWGCTRDEGLVCFDPETGQTQIFQHHNAKMKSLPLNTIRCHFIDAQDNLWLGTDGAGVSSVDLKPPRFNLFPLNDGDYPFLKDYFTKCFYEDEKGRLWVGTHSNGFNIINRTTLAVKNYEHNGKQPITAVGSIFCDRKGNMLIGCAEGIFLFEEQQKKFNAIPISPAVLLEPKTIYVNDMKQLPDGDIACATQWGLAMITNKQGQYRARSYYGVNNLGCQATSIAVGDSDIIWMATTYAGLMKIRKRGDSAVLLDKCLTSVNIRSVRRDEKDQHILWVATAKGLIQYNHLTGKMRVYNEKDGMANSFVYGSLEDNSHNFWISTNGGLIYFDRANRNFLNYNVHNGLQSNEFNTGAFCKSASGIFYFGGIKGFNWFGDHPSSYDKMATRPKVALTAIMVNDHIFQRSPQFEQDHRLVLPYHRNKLSFNFAALDFTRPKANKVKYMLTGWDRSPIISYHRNAVYPNLPPGNYTLSVQACNADGVWSNTERLYITIRAPFWNRWWFYSMVTLFLLLTAILLTRYWSGREFRKKLRELEQQRAIEAERNRISKDMHDEIGSGLTHIALMTELIHTQKKADEELRHEVGNISSSARRLVESMSEIIWALNPQNDSMENLLVYMREQALHHFEPFDIEMHIDFPAAVPPVRLTNEQRRNIFLVAKEALNNALKHAQAKHISFTATYQDHTLYFHIQDDGAGFQKDTIRKAANGLKNMQKRMEDIGGSFRVETSGRGTDIYFEFNTKQH